MLTSLAAAGAVRGDGAGHGLQLGRCGGRWSSPTAGRCARGASRRRGRRSAVTACPGRPPPAGTGWSVAAERGHRQRRRDAELGVAAEHGHAPRLRPRRRRPASDPRRERGVAGADGVEQPDGRGAHRGEVVDVDEHAAPAGPLGVALDQRRDDRVAGRDDVACRAPARRRRRRTPAAAEVAARPAAARAPTSSTRAWRGEARRSASASARAGGRRAYARRAASSPAGANSGSLAGLHRGVEAQRAEALGVCAGGARPAPRRRPTSGARRGRTTRRPPVHQPRSGLGAPARAAPRRAPSPSAARATSTTVRGSSSTSSASRAGEQALLGDEDLAAQPAVGGERRRRRRRRSTRPRPVPGVAARAAPRRSRRRSASRSAARRSAGRCTPRTRRSRRSGRRRACRPPASSSPTRAVTSATSQDGGAPDPVDVDGQRARRSGR